MVSALAYFATVERLWRLPENHDSWQAALWMNQVGMSFVHASGTKSSSTKAHHSPADVNSDCKAVISAGLTK